MRLFWHDFCKNTNRTAFDSNEKPSKKLKKIMLLLKKSVFL